MRALILLAVLSACGQAPKHVDASLRPYFERFEAVTGVATAGVSGEFVALPPGTYGVCLTNYSNTYAVQIDPVKWAASSEDQREETVFHELGHCAMRLKHKGLTDEHGCPSSIMYPFAFGDGQCYAAHKEAYYRTLVLDYNSNK